MMYLALYLYIPALYNTKHFLVFFFFYLFAFLNSPYKRTQTPSYICYTVVKIKSYKRSKGWTIKDYW